MIVSFGRALVERSKDDLARTMTNMMTRSGEVAQEQNHMIEGLSTSLASLLQLTTDHSESFYR